jgi:hypothetical protein
MRLWTVPVIALGVMVVSLSDEPNERAMRGAFESSLAAQVQNALDFVAETSGPEAVAKVRAAGTDRFEISGFRKLGCQPREAGGHVCRFAVDIAVMNGNVHEVLTGRFFRRDDGLAFSHDT